MQKIMSKWWLYVVIVIVGVYFWGVNKMYFHQDDLDWFILADRPFFEVMQAPIGDHINYVWRALLSLEWKLFGLNFEYYLAVSLILHGVITWLLYKIAEETTKRKDLSAIVAVLFVLNTNWTETILWISGQTILITGLFVLLSIRAIWHKKYETLSLLLSSWTSALAIGVVGASAFGYKKLRKSGVAIMLSLIIIYKYWGGDGTRIEYSFEWIIKVIEVASLMTINTVIGRLIIPFDRYELIRIGLVVLAMLYGVWRYRKQLFLIYQDVWTSFLIYTLIFYNLIVAGGRAQFGVGIMRAERYAYLGLAVTLLIGVRMARKTKFGGWVWILPVLMGMQIGGFYRRASDYVVRPNQLKQLIYQIQGGEKLAEPDRYLPYFVLNDERLKYGDLYRLMDIDQ